MKKILPFVSIDTGLYFNLATLMVVLSRLSLNSRGRYVLDFERLQYFIYLVKNPARIEPVLMLSGKKIPSFDSRHIHTLESMSSNVDILFQSEKLRSLITRLASVGFLGTVASKDGNRTYYLSEDGEIFLQSMIEADHEAEGYMSSLIKFSNAISGLQSLPLTKLSSIISQVFREEAI